MAIFQTKITKARLTLSPFTSEQMLTIGNALATSVIKRIKTGKNANDEPSKPLKGAKKHYVPYARYKQNRGLQPIRDWVYSGRTLRSLKVLSVSENGGKVGFTDQRANSIATYINKIDRAFGISPTDRLALNNALGDVLRGGNVIQFKRAA
jgi:hypothetical protein